MRSRCNTQAPWQYATAARVICMYDLISGVPRGRNLSFITASRSDSQHSNTRCRFRLCGKQSTSSMTFGCRSSCSSLISRMAVKFTPSLNFPRRIFLMATALFVTVSVALVTTPNVPSPSVAPFTYLFMP